MSMKPNESNEKQSWESVAGRPEAGATYGPQRTTGAEGTTPVLWRGSRPRRPNASPRNHEEERRGGDGGEGGEGARGAAGAGQVRSDRNVVIHMLATLAGTHTRAPHHFEFFANRAPHWML